MRIQFDNVNLASRSGPNTFAGRLARTLIEQGHEVCFDANADVSLVFIEPSGKPLSKIIVQRIDGIWFKPDDFYTKNHKIKGLYDTASAVVFQSHFDRMMIEHWWQGRDKKNDVVIRNGIELNPVKEITIPELAKIRATYDKVFVCSANWHPQKRLRANIQLFDHVRKTLYPNSCLFVMGANPDVMTTDPHVFFTGSQPPEVYMQVFAVADWMFHLAWADHCPNVVVEALSQGTPVVCSQVGGTRELIDNGSYGLVLSEQDYNFELFDYDKPPQIDVTQVKSLPTRHDLRYDLVSVDIKDTALSYVKLFDTLISK